MGDFFPNITADCDGGSLVTVDVTAPWNIQQVIVHVNHDSFVIDHDVDFAKVPDGDWWVMGQAVITHIPELNAAVSATFYEVDSEGHVFPHVGHVKFVVAPPATDCAVPTTAAPLETTTTTTAGSVPPPTLPAISTTTAVVVHPPHQVHRLPATGTDPVLFGVGCLVIAAGIGLLVKGSRIGER